MQQGNHVVNAKIGIGWSDAGLEKYNDLYDMVLEDRVSRGAVFNNELLNVFLGRRHQRNSKPTPEPELKKRKVVPRDDMGLNDASFKNVLLPGMIADYHPSVQL